MELLRLLVTDVAGGANPDKLQRHAGLCGRHVVSILLKRALTLRTLYM